MPWWLRVSSLVQHRHELSLSNPWLQTDRDLWVSGMEPKRLQSRTIDTSFTGVDAKRVRDAFFIRRRFLKRLRRAQALARGMLVRMHAEHLRAGRLEKLLVRNPYDTRLRCKKNSIRA